METFCIFKTTQGFAQIGQLLETTVETKTPTSWGCPWGELKHINNEFQCLNYLFNTTDQSVVMKSMKDWCWPSWRTSLDPG